MWRLTTTDLNKLDVFHRTCLRKSAEEILAQPSEQRRALLSNREYTGISPYTTEKMVMDRAHIEDKSWQHLEDCTNVGT